MNHITNSSPQKKENHKNSPAILNILSPITKERIINQQGALAYLLTTFDVADESFDLHLWRSLKMDVSFALCHAI